MQIDPLIDEFLQERVVRGLAVQTVDQYRWALTRLRKVASEMPETRREILPAMADPALSNESRRDLLKCLRRFSGWAERHYNIPNAAALIEPAPKRRNLPRVFTQAEIAQVLGAARSPRDRALILLVLDTGLRLGEVANLRSQDIKEGWLVVNGKTGVRQVPVSDEVRSMLLELCDGEHVWTGQRGPIERNGVNLAYRRTFKRSGLTGPKLGPHTLRHTFGTAYIRAGGGVRQLQYILGHSRIDTTMIYGHLAGLDVQADHAVHSPARVMGLL